MTFYTGAAALAASTETGSIGIMHLKRYWEKNMAKRNGSLSPDVLHDEWNLDVSLLCALGLGLEQTITYLYQSAPDFQEFEQWVLALNGGAVSTNTIQAFNELVANNNTNFNNKTTVDVLSKDDLAFWDANGYVIVRNAVPKHDCEESVQVICDFLGIDIQDPATWYQQHFSRQGIMVQLFQHPVLERNRKANTIKGAYEQLWGKTGLWMNTDRVSFNPPENERWTFPGPRLHWDVSLELPIPFGLQGLLYLTDTQENQGAFTLVPGFHNIIETWINSLPAGADPRMQDLYQLGPKPIAAYAGDFILWHQALPHGSSPNTHTLPRIVQYINYLPIDGAIKETWR
ncbi:MAG TPA: phytanoyl-CoA dioxygenase family protein [Chitinophagaceae bacterium]|nr:phytanoyl-CoA dioxygenase family protein [Chitinophagaceae bacterium]